MEIAYRDPDTETTFRAALGVAVLVVAIGCANVGSLPIDTSPYVTRLGDTTIRDLFVTGFVLQLGTGTWLALSLLLDIRRALRLALFSWLGALSLYVTPVPTLRDDAAAALLPLVVVSLVALVGWALDESLRERAGAD